MSKTYQICETQKIDSSTHNKSRDGCAYNGEQQYAAQIGEKVAWKP
jgi:hypothetical protein